MYIYSEKTNKKYNTVEECQLAEMEYDERIEKEKAEKERLASEKEARRKEVEDAYGAIFEARKKADDLLDKYLNDYDDVDLSIKSYGVPSLRHIFDLF